MDAYSLGETQPAHAADEHIATTLVDAGLRNEPYEMALGEGLYDVLTKFGTAFGFGGDDSLQGTLMSNDFLYGGAGNDSLRATGGDDFLFGQDDDDRLSGGAGIDHLFGGAGRDTLDGGGGPNVLVGGSGDDSYILHSGREALREYANGGIDLVMTAQGMLSLTATQFANVENLSFTGTGNFRGTGNGLNNALTGGSGDDTLSGGDGNDTLTGQGGDDRLWGGAGSDSFVFGPDLGRDVVMDFADGADQIVFHHVTGVGSVAEAMAHASQSGADVAFDFGPGDSLTVLHINLASLMGDILVT
jgi:Ca2+-binding RTX toxin-like protein